MKKKIICLLLVVVLAFGCSTTSFAAEQQCIGGFQKEISAYMKTATSMIENMRKSTEATLEKNNIHTDYRHIKVTWEKVSDVSRYDIQISDNLMFKDAETKHRYPRTGFGNYWNFSLTNDIESTYYIRVRPVFAYKFNNEYFAVYGRWSNVVVANGAD